MLGGHQYITVRKLEMSIQKSNYRSRAPDPEKSFSQYRDSKFVKDSLSTKYNAKHNTVQLQSHPQIPCNILLFSYSPKDGV